METGRICKVTDKSGGPIFHFHVYGRKGNLLLTSTPVSPPLFSPIPFRIANEEGAKFSNLLQTPRNHETVKQQQITISFHAWVLQCYNLLKTELMNHESKRLVFVCWLSCTVFYSHHSPFNTGIWQLRNISNELVTASLHTTVNDSAICKANSDKMTDYFAYNPLLLSQRTMK